MVALLNPWMTSATPASGDRPTDLRELYRSAETRGYRSARVGRLAVQLIEKDATRRVGIDHRFRSGEKFRFEISSNRDGWLYVLHRSPAGEPQLLWPRMGSGGGNGYVDDNRVRTRNTALVPPAPDVFLFDDEVGSEYFYLVIRPERNAPRLTALASPAPAPIVSPAAPPPAAPPRPVPARPTAASRPAGPVQGQRIVQFSVRGMGGQGAVPGRGVVLLPGGDKAEPDTYFAPHPEDRPDTVVFEFRLHHE